MDHKTASSPPPPMSQFGAYSYQPLSDQQIPLRVGGQPQSTRRRFFKAFAIAAVVVTLFHLTTRTVVHLGHSHGSGHWVRTTLIPTDIMLNKDDLALWR
jgi:hypothetical protein